MKSVLDVVLLVLNIITFVISHIGGLLFFGYAYFVGEEKLKKVLKRSIIPLTFWQAFAIIAISAVATYILFIIRDDVPSYMQFL